MLLVTADLKESDFLGLLLPKLQIRVRLSLIEFVDLLLGSLNVPDFFDFLVEIFVLLFDARVVAGDVGVLREDVVEFVVSEEVVSPHLVVQILMVLFYLGHF